eukprot:scaffold2755_cov134-Skeletonema_marinoi.AAC.18
MASVTDGASNIGRGSQRRGKTMRVSDFVSSSFDRFDQQNMSGNGPSSSNSTNNSANHVLTAAEEQSHATGSSRRNGHNNGDGNADEVAPMSFAHSILLDLLRRSNNDLQNYSGTTSLPLLLIALARVVIALLSLLLSICGIVLHVLLAVTIRILFVVVDGVGFVQRALWSVVERVVTRIAIRMDWQQKNRPCHHHHDHRSNGHNHHLNNSNSGSHDSITSTSTNHHGDTRGGGGGTFGILESYRKHLLHQLSLIIPSTTTRNKLDTLPDIMNNTPPSLSLFALVTALAFIVHPDGLTWIVLGKLCEGVWLGLKLLRGAATAIVAAMLSSSANSSSDEGGGGGGGSSSIGSETLSTIVASAVLASLILLGKVMYRALYKKNTVTDAAQTTPSSSSSSSKKKKGRRGRNSGRHGNHHNRSGHRNNKRDATADSSSSTTTSRTDSSSHLTTHHSKQQQPLRSRSRSYSPCTTRTDSTSSFVQEKEITTDAIPKPKVTEDDDNEATGKESKERSTNDKKENVSLTGSNNSCSNNIGNGKSAPVQQLPHDPAHDILSKLRPDSTDSLSVPQLLDEDVSLGSSVAGSVAFDCGSKQGGGANRVGGGGGGNTGSSNTTTKKRGGTRGKYNGGGPTSTNGTVRAPPGFISKDSTSSSTKSSSLSRNTASNSKAYPGKNSSLYERNTDDRKQKQPFFPKKKSRDMNNQHKGTRTRASTSDCVIREHEVHSSPLFGSNNGTITTAGRMVSPGSSVLSSTQHRLHHEQRVRVASTNELTSPYRLSTQVSQESSLLNNGAMMRNNLNSPISPPAIRPPPGLGFGSPVEMNSFGHGRVGGVELAPANNNHAVSGPTLSLSSPARPQPQPQARQFSSYDQSNFLLQPSVFPSMSNNHKMKESATSEDDRIDADLQQLGDQMVGSVLDF